MGHKEPRNCWASAGAVLLGGVFPDDRRPVARTGARSRSAGGVSGEQPREEGNTTPLHYRTSFVLALLGRCEDHVGDSLGGVAVPEGRRLCGRLASLSKQGRDAGNRGGVEAEQSVGARGKRDRSLGVVAEGEAGDAKVGGLLLDAAGVGEDGAGG